MLSKIIKLLKQVISLFVSLPKSYGTGFCKSLFNTDETFFNITILAYNSNLKFNIFLCICKDTGVCDTAVSNCITFSQTAFF